MDGEPDERRSAGKRTVKRLPKRKAEQTARPETRQRENQGTTRTKRMAPWLTAMLLAGIVLLAAGCGGANSAAPREGERADRLRVVASFYPLYDFAVKIAGEHADVVNLVPAGVDSHDWSPKLREMQQIAEADLFLYLGAGYEGWVEDFLAALDSVEGPAAVEVSRGTDLIRLSEARADGARADGHGVENGNGHAGGHADEDGHANDRAEEDGHADESVHAHDHTHNVDPHVWLSPKQAVVLAANIKDALVGADPDHRDDYEARYNQLVGQLDGLDARMKKVAAEATKQTFIVSHESFGYLARDYGLTQIGVMGIAPDAEPTARKLQEIREAAEALDIRYILFEELVSPKVAETLAESLGIETLVLNPLEGLTEAQLQAGDDYFSVMERNLTTLAKALD